ncbi:hypothetical protein JCM13991_21190 [Thermodesulfovibrio hydrogeniphilus]
MRFSSFIVSGYHCSSFQAFSITKQRSEVTKELAMILKNLLILLGNIITFEITLSNQLKLKNESAQI